MYAINPIVATLLFPLTTGGFGTNSALATRRPFFATSVSPDAVDAASHPVSISSSPPSWDELAATLQSQESTTAAEPPVVTLYRDTNGWCPFCERVWILLRAKGIPYDEQLISLQNKPEWYKQLVPTTQVPALLFHGDGEKNERKIVWESLDVMKALDEAFPSTPRMILDTPEYKEAMEMNDCLTAAGVAVVYAGREEGVTEDDKESRRLAFLEELDKLDAALAESEGPFRLGKDFTGLDATMIPTLERWRYQLPISVGIDILDNHPNIRHWFEHMDTFEPYGDRVAGDAYSWTATNAMFLRYFGGGEEKPDVAEAIKRAEIAAEQLSQSFSEGLGDDSFALEAAEKLISNHVAIVQDCTREEPLSQKDVPRARNEDTADAVLRYVANIMLLPNPSETAKDAPLLEIPKDEMRDASRAARTVASRLCVPRDMGAPAAKLLRGVLATVADRLDRNV